MLDESSAFVMYMEYGSPLSSLKHPVGVISSRGSFGQSFQPVVSKPLSELHVIGPVGITPCKPLTASALPEYPTPFTVKTSNFVSVLKSTTSIAGDGFSNKSNVHVSLAPYLAVLPSHSSASLSSAPDLKFVLTMQPLPSTVHGPEVAIQTGFIGGPGAGPGAGPGDGPGPGAGGPGAGGGEGPLDSGVTGNLLASVGMGGGIDQ